MYLRICKQDICTPWKRRFYSWNLKQNTCIITVITLTERVKFRRPQLAVSIVARYSTYSAVVWPYCIVFSEDRIVMLKMYNDCKEVYRLFQILNVIYKVSHFQQGAGQVMPDTGKLERIYYRTKEMGTYTSMDFFSEFHVEVFHTYSTKQSRRHDVILYIVNYEKKITNYLISRFSYSISNMKCLLFQLLYFYTMSSK